MWYNTTNIINYIFMREKVLVISSSNNKKGNSALLAKWFISGTKKNKYEFEWVYLYDLNIPYFTNENRDARIEADKKDKEIRDLINKIEAADKIIITTPIWNFGLPSSLKNMIDRALASGRIWSEEKQKKVPGWKGKKIYLFFSMGAPWYLAFPDLLAILQLYLTLKYYGASPKMSGAVDKAGNGSKIVIQDREKIKKCIMKKAKRL